jgi:hypothetical protein
VYDFMIIFRNFGSNLYSDDDVVWNLCHQVIVWNYMSILCVKLLSRTYIFNFKTQHEWLLFHQMKAKEELDIYISKLLAQFDKTTTGIHWKENRKEIQHTNRLMDGLLTANRLDTFVIHGCQLQYIWWWYGNKKYRYR